MSDPREAELLQALQAREEELARVNKELAAAQKEITRLRESLDALSRRLFGKKSEQLDPSQLELLLRLSGNELGKADAASEKEVALLLPLPASAVSRLRKARAPRLPENLPVIEETIVPAPVQAAPQAYRRIGEEVSEQIDYEPGRFFRRRLIRPKYVHRTEKETAPLIAALPPSLQERCIAAPGLIAQILVGKFCDHLPLYRQQQIFKSRFGVELPRQTMARWMGLAAEWLKPVYEAVRSVLVAQGYLQVDETPIEYLSPGNGETRQGYFWAYSAPGGDVLFSWQTSRAAACLEKVIPVNFSGTLQCDGYGAYEAFAKCRSEITLAGCWAHVRRKFHDALEHSPRLAGWILRQIQYLYRVEADLRKRRAGPKLRAAVRAAQSRPIIKRLEKSLQKLKASHRILPKSLLGKAIDYALGQWSTLGVYLENGRVEIDNNLCENAIRPTAIGKKNWLFIGEAQAGERASIIYTLIECCRRRGIDPYTYLRDVLSRLPSMTNWQIKDITPEAWAKARRIDSLKAAA